MDEMKEIMTFQGILSLKLVKKLFRDLIVSRWHTLLSWVKYEEPCKKINYTFTNLLLVVRRVFHVARDVQTGVDPATLFRPVPQKHTIVGYTDCCNNDTLKQETVLHSMQQTTKNNISDWKVVNGVLGIRFSPEVYEVCSAHKG
jgi:hypothetical protein